MAGKKSALLNGVLMIKNKLSLLAGKICSVCWRIWSIKIQRLFWFITRPCLKFAERFSASATLHSQKIVKEIAYIPTSFQAPLEAKYFLSKPRQNSFVDYDCFFISPLLNTNNLRDYKVVKFITKVNCFVLIADYTIHSAI